MLKRSITAIQKWLSTRQATQSLPVQSDGSTATRRSFFKKAAIGAISISATAELAKVVVDSVPQNDMKNHYIKDALAGEEELINREYVLMSDQEMAEMVRTFVDNYDQT